MDDILTALESAMSFTTPLFFFLLTPFLALPLTLAAYLVVGRANYFQAWKAFVFGQLGGSACNFLLVLLFGRLLPEMVLWILCIVLGIFIQATAVGAILTDKDKIAIGTGRGCLVNFTTAFIIAVPCLLLAIALPSVVSARDKFQKLAALRDATRTGSPSATPHPAVSSRQLALQLYPALSVPDSPMNRQFLRLHAEVKLNEPRLLTTPDWPLVLADRAVILVGGNPVPHPPAKSN